MCALVTLQVVPNGAILLGRSVLGRHSVQREWGALLKCAVDRNLTLVALNAKGQCATWENTIHVKMGVGCENPNNTVSALHYSLLHLGIWI